MSPELLPDSSSTASPTPICTPYTIPQGILIINETFEISLTEHAVFKPHCVGGDSGVVHSGFSDNSTVTDQRPPFYASTSPQIFAIAVATVISYVLVVLIFITPRTFFVGGPGGGAGFLTRRGLSGSSSVIGIGRRPLLQKIAAVMVAMSLTIATALTFNVAKSQYADGFMNSETMVREVVGALEIRIIQVVSDTFLWLAQVQTLIRLFPRHKEKVTIKWLGFALISLDVIFSCLNNFLPYGMDARPVRSRDAIPALSYLFELAIGFIYASCVIYYSISKYRFAFYHAKMRNICLVALISMTSVLIPVVFFVIDVSSPDIATWGFYIRWVGAIAASVVVWEWVERIEALERDETKDGILGREIYDGDEMLDVTTTNGVNFFGEKSRPPGHGGGGGGGGGNLSRSRRALRVKARRIRSRIPFVSREQASESIRGDVQPGSRRNEPMTVHDIARPSPPAAVAVPASRLDSTSAASTVYTVCYHTVQASSPDTSQDEPYHTQSTTEIPQLSGAKLTAGRESKTSAMPPPRSQAPIGHQQQSSLRPLWTTVANPFKRKRSSPPAEVAGAQLLQENAHQSPGLVKSDKLTLRSRMGTFSALQRNRFRMHGKSSKADEPLPVTVIPARPRGSRTWSPTNAALDADGEIRGPVCGDDGDCRGDENLLAAGRPQATLSQNKQSAEDRGGAHGEEFGDTRCSTTPRSSDVSPDENLMTADGSSSGEVRSPTTALNPSNTSHHEPARQEGPASASVLNATKIGERTVDKDIAGPGQLSEAPDLPQHQPRSPVEPGALPHSNDPERNRNGSSPGRSARAVLEETRSSREASPDEQP